MEYKHIICGGTFDRLHKGHKAFLEFAFSKGKKVLIGLTSDAYVQSQKKDPTILPFIRRKKDLELFLQKENLLQRAQIVKISSRFDETKIANSNSTALLVTTETEKVGKEINKEREMHNLLPLPLLVFSLVKDKGDQKISSSHIRTLILPQVMRQILRKPFGPVFLEIPTKLKNHEDSLIAVGDETTRRFHAMSIFPKLSVVDFMVERKKQFSSLLELGFSGNEDVLYLANKAGTLNGEVWNVLQDLQRVLQQKNHIILQVTGEEDLLVIPIILVFPVGFTICYGQPGKGLVVLTITPTLKQKIYKILANFTLSA